MRVLHINKFAWAKGGAEVYARELARRQHLAGHNVALLGAEGGAQQFSPVPGVRHFDIDIDDFHTVPTHRKVRVAADILWSRAAAARVAEVARRFEPEIVHLHNYAHQLSSSIVELLRGLNIRTVNTAHDYKLVCPAYVANIGGEDCFACADHVSMKLITHACHHGSRPWSALVAAESLVVRSRRALPDLLVAPSEFMLNHLRQSWIGSDHPIALARNPAAADDDWTGGGGYLLYVGRLSREKGIADLILSAAEADLPLVIAGDGPIRSELEDLTRETGSSAQFVGHLAPEDIAELRRKCRAQVVSSVWPENAPLALLEAVVQGVPVIATARGGVPELAVVGAPIALVEAMTPEALRRAVVAVPTVDRESLAVLRERLSWNLHVGTLDRLYGELLDAPIEQ